MSAGAGYSAGTIFLDVVPSFHNSQRRISQAGSKDGITYLKAAEKGLAPLPKIAENIGDEAGEKAGNAFAKEMNKRVRASLAAIGDIEIDADSSKAQRQIFKLRKQIDLMRDIQLTPDFDGAAALAKAAKLDKQIDALLRDKSIDVDVRSNLGTARAELAEMARFVRQAIGPSRDEYAQALQQEKAFNAAKVESQKQMYAEAYRLDQEFNLRGRRKREEAAEAERQMYVEAYRLNKDFDLQRLEARKVADARWRQEDARLSEAHELAKARVRAAVLQQTEAEQRSGRTGTDADLLAAQSAIKARYEAEEQAAAAASKRRIAAAGRAMVGEEAAAAQVEQAVKESYREQIEAASRAAAIRTALARATAQQQAAAERNSQSTVRALLAQNTGQAANSFRIFNGYLLAAVTIGPLIIPVLASIAAGLVSVAVGATAAVAGVGALVAGFAGIGGAVGALAALDREGRKQSSGSSASDAAKDTRALRDAQVALARAREDAGLRIEAANRRQADSEKALTQAVRDAADAQRDLVRARRSAAEDLEDLNNQLLSGTMAEQQAAFSLQEAGYRLNNVLEDDQATDREKRLAQLAYDQEAQSFKELQIQNRRLATEVAAANAAGVEGAEQVVAAKEAIVSTNDQVLNAERDVADAQRDLSRARVDEARAITDAEQRVGDAMYDLEQKSAAAGVAGSAAMDALNEAMLPLTPTAQAFATFLYGLKPFFDSIRAISQEGLLPGVQSGISTLLDAYGPDFVKFIGSISKILGQMAQDAAEALTSPFWEDFFKTMAKFAPGFLESFGLISEGLSELIAGVMMAFAPYADSFFAAIAGIAQSMGEWGQNLAGTKAFQGFMKYLQDVGPRVWELLVLIGDVVLKMMEGLAPYVDKLIDFALGFFGYLDSLDAKQIGMIALAIFGIVAGLQALAGIIAILSSFAGLLSGVFGTFAALGAGGAAAGAGGAAAASGPVGWIILAVAAAIAAIVGLVFWLKHLYETNEEFKANFDKVWRAIQQIVLVAWNVFIRPVLQAFSTFYENFIQPALTLFATEVQKNWDLVTGVFDVGWQAISKVADMISQIFEFILMPLLVDWYEKSVKPVWETKIQPIFDALGDIFNATVVPAWREGIKALSALFDGIRELFAAPIRWVVETVINEGLIGSFNDLASRVPGMTKVEPVTLPASLAAPKRTGSGSGGGFAAGGVLPGYTPGRDVHTFVSPTGGRLDLSGGEGILVPELTRILGKKWIMGANRAARSGTGLGSYLGGFAGGGVIGDIGDWISGAASSATDAIAGFTGGAVDFLRDPAAGLRELVEAIFSAVPGGQTDLMQSIKGVPLYAVDAIGALLGGKTKAEPIVGGAMTYPWLISTILGAFPGARISSSYRPGAITATGGASYHGIGRAIDVVPPTMALFNWIKQNYPRSTELLYSPAGARQILRQGREGDTSGVTRAMHFNHLHWAYKDGGVVPNLYDNGGYIPPGLSVVANKTGKPERILTDSQWESLAKNAGTSRGAEINFHGDVNGGEELARKIAEQIAQKQRDAAVVSQLSSIGVLL